jgi:hypothetical protein
LVVVERRLGEALEFLGRLMRVVEVIEPVYGLGYQLEG